ncbi:MAG: hypothetical protein AAFZ07_09220 [Actinomycetota bacterium]
MRCRPAEPSDITAIEEIFTATVGLGAPAPFELPAGYTELCLGWYLGAGRPDAAVLVDEGRVVGYALVCCDEAAHRSWVRRRAVRFGLRSIPAALAPRGDPARKSFVRLRLRDGLAMGAGPPAPARAHAHVNLLRSVRTGTGGRHLVRHIDSTVASAGLDAWYAEINAPVGRRAPALARLGGEVVHRAPNRTLTALAGRDVERLTLLRRLEDAVPLFGAARPHQDVIGQP